VGMKAILKPGLDDVITSYRAHGWCYLQGASVLGVLAELLGMLCYVVLCVVYKYITPTHISLYITEFTSGITFWFGWKR
jgi:hypothetical protein